MSRNYLLLLEALIASAISEKDEGFFKGEFLSLIKPFPADIQTRLLGLARGGINDLRFI